MLIRDIDIHKIEKLLQSVPDGIDCECIMFVGNSYQLRLIAGTEELKQVEKTQALQELHDILSKYGLL